MTDRRPLLRAIFDAAVARAHPDQVLAAHLPPPPAGRIVCLAAGKGAAALAAAAERHYLDTLHLPPERLTGLATTRHGHAVATRRIAVIEAGHPVPDAASQNAAERTLQFAREAQRDDLVLVLLSGGGSANWIAPVDGISLAQKQNINRALLRSGANIGAMNAVRKHLSRIKGGRLAREAQPAPVVTLAISDVPDDDPAVIASGPTVPDPTTLSDAREVLARFSIAPDEAIAKALNDPSNESCKAAEAFFAEYTGVVPPISAPRGARPITASDVRDFPQPDSPISPRTSPGRTSKLTPSTTLTPRCRSGKRTVRSRTDRTGSTSPKSTRRAARRLAAASMPGRATTWAPASAAVSAASARLIASAACLDT